MKNDHQARDSPPAHGLAMSYFLASQLSLVDLGSSLLRKLELHSLSVKIELSSSATPPPLE